MRLAAFALLIAALASPPAATAEPAVMELRRAIASVATLEMDTAKLDNAALAAYAVVRERLRLPPLEASARLRLPGYDVTRLLAFAADLERSPTSERVAAARSLVLALAALRELHGEWLRLSDEIFSGGHQATLLSLSFAARLNRAGTGLPLGPALAARIRASAAAAGKSAAGFLAAHLPPDIAPYAPLALFVGGALCDRALGVPGRAPESGATAFAI